MFRPLFLGFCSLFLLLISSCSSGLKKLPFYIRIDIEADSMKVWALNPNPYPTTVFLRTESEALEKQMQLKDGFVSPPDSNRLLYHFPMKGKDSASLVSEMKFESYIGNPLTAEPDSSARYQYPFPKGKSYSIMQPYKGSFSHNNPFSLHAIDFAIPIGDTICAARDGIVAGVIQHHNKGGGSRKYRDFANFITLYHEDGIMTQYVHLVKDGALVEKGDRVGAGQKIGISGLTGFTSAPHLHFNVLKPVSRGAVSIPVQFEQMDGKALKKGMKVSH